VPTFSALSASTIKIKNLTFKRIGSRCAAYGKSTNTDGTVRAKIKV